MLSRREYLASLPRKRVGAGALIRDESGRVLMVEPTYRDGWILPGGTIEADQSPAAGVARELVEELGVALPVGRLLAIEWVHADDDPHGALQLIYDGGVVDAATIMRFRLPPEELASFCFVEPETALVLATPGGRTRLGAALTARVDGAVAEVDRLQ